MYTLFYSLSLEYILSVFEIYFTVIIYLRILLQFITFYYSPSCFISVQHVLFRLLSFITVDHVLLQVIVLLQFMMLYCSSSYFIAVHHCVYYSSSWFIAVRHVITVHPVITVHHGLLQFIMVFSWVDYQRMDGYPYWADVLGWLMTFSVVLAIFIPGLVLICTMKGPISEVCLTQEFSNGSNFSRGRNFKQGSPNGEIVRACVCTYVRAYIHTYIHTYIYIYTTIRANTNENFTKKMLHQT